MAEEGGPELEDIASSGNDKSVVGGGVKMVGNLVGAVLGKVKDEVVEDFKEEAGLNPKQQVFIKEQPVVKEPPIINISKDTLKPQQTPQETDSKQETVDVLPSSTKTTSS